MVHVFLWGIILLMAGELLYRKQLSRNARIKHLSQRWGADYCPYKNSLITHDNAAKLDFFSADAFSFHHIITQKEGAVFIRIADAMREGASRPSALADLTVFSAEYFLGGWPAVKVTPKDGTFQPGHLTEVPLQDKQISQHYHIFLSSPEAARVFTPALQRLLKRQTNIYLEIYNNALIYHEGQLLPPAEWDAFRLRALQLLAALNPQQPPFMPKTFHSADETPDAQVQALLAAASPRRYATAPQQESSFGLYKAVILVLLLLLVPAFIYFITRHLPH